MTRVWKNTDRYSGEALKSPTSGSMDFRVKFASNDDYIWYRSYYTSVTDYSGKVYRIVGRSDSIEKDMRIAADWKKRACHDALTGMLNHDATIEVLKKRIIESGGNIFQYIITFNMSE